MTVTVMVSARSSANPDNSGVRLTIKDDVSRETVVDVEFTYEEFSRVLMNQVTPGIHAKFGELARVGLEPIITSKRSFHSYTQAKTAEDWAAKQRNGDGPLQRTQVTSTNDGKTTVIVTTWKRKV